MNAVSSAQPDRNESDRQDRTQQRVRERAYRIWLDEGRPDGRASDHWDKASELVAIEENYMDTLKPGPTEGADASSTGEPVEPIEAVRNLGEFPAMTDQGEKSSYPDRGFVADADAGPLRKPPLKEAAGDQEPVKQEPVREGASKQASGEQASGKQASGKRASDKRASGKRASGEEAAKTQPAGAGRKGAPRSSSQSTPT